jgi:hypothetical protein
MDMPYAKTSLRADQRVLRENMRAVGMSHRQIAVEFARRYRLQPRAAWRNAYGWSQTEAAHLGNEALALDNDAIDRAARPDTSTWRTAQALTNAGYLLHGLTLPC